MEDRLKTSKRSVNFFSAGTIEPYGRGLSPSPVGGASERKWTVVQDERRSPSISGAQKSPGSTKSPSTPSVWESPVASRSITLRARAETLSRRTLLSVAGFVFFVVIFVGCVLVFATGQVLDEWLTVILLLAMICTMIASLLVQRSQRNFKKKISMEVSDRAAKLLGIAEDSQGLVQKTRQRADSRGAGGVAATEARIATPPRFRGASQDSNQALQRYISPARDQNTVSASSSLAQGRSGLRMWSQSPIGKYHESRVDSASLDSAEIAKEPRMINLEPGSDGFGVSRLPRTQRSVEALRRWLAVQVLVPYAQREVACSAKLKQLSSLQNVDQALARELLTERSNLDRYVTVPTYPRAMDYARARLRTLAEDTSVSKAKWNSGADWKGRSFETFGMELPTDSELILVALGAYFDERLPPTTAAQAAFTSRFVAFPPSGGTDSIEPWRIKAGAVIFRSKNRPPHFSVIAPGGKVLNVPSGRSNVFIAILLLLQILRDEYDGYAGQIYLGDSSIALLDVLDA
mmetsp:Transcript_7874/g.23774  ORF Transcript_7874/g.23774 Transcript_7874/m.23774 type:complete len:519 (+) Transcript_7874:59-1615(+)